VVSACSEVSILDTCTGGSADITPSFIKNTIYPPYISRYNTTSFRKYKYFFNEKREKDGVMSALLVQGTAALDKCSFIHFGCPEKASERFCIHLAIKPTRKSNHLKSRRLEGLPKLLEKVSETILKNRCYSNCGCFSTKNSLV
jgi:hypothetical protein